MVVYLSLLLAPSTASASIDLTVGDYGVSLGHADHAGQRLNGLNISGWVPSGPPYEKINGLSIGLLGPHADRINGIAIGGFAIDTSVKLKWNTTREVTGLSVGLIQAGAKEKTTGSAIGLVVRSEQITGLAAGLFALANRFKGIAVGGIEAGGFDETDGIAISYFAVNSAKINGVAIGGMVPGSQEITGLLISVYNVTEQMNGVSIGLWNIANRLNGVQIGLVNCAENLGALKCLPFFNMYFSGFSGDTAHKSGENGKGSSSFYREFMRR
jgi:hypothetical protein